MNMEVVPLVLEFGSPQYDRSVVLRDLVLRKPLGLKFSNKDLLAEEDQIHIALSQNREIIGILLLKKTDDPATIKMRQVAILPELQGKGLGKKLVRFAENYALNHGYKKMELHARRHAIPFYLAQDYLVVSDEFEEVGIPHRKMEKLLK